MKILALFVLLFSVVQLLVVLSNLFFRPKLYPVQSFSTPLVSVLIPARNEDKNIGNLLRSLQTQNYSALEIIVFNDQSSDNTQKIVNDYSKKDQRISLINSTNLPPGWMGKNYACHQMAQKARGEYYLFLDADVILSNNIIAESISFVEKYQLALLTIFPKQILKSWGEYLTVPNMNFILLSLLPLVLVQKSKFPSLAAANGQFMFFEAKTYTEILPHKTLKNEKVEDIKTARLFKKQHKKVSCLTGNNSITCHMYHSFEEAVNGFSKNVLMFFGNSPLLAIVAWLLNTFGFVIIALFLPPANLLIYFILLVGIHVIISKISEQHTIKNLVLAFPQKLIIGLLIYKAIRNSFKKTEKWKGRII